MGSKHCDDKKFYIYSYLRSSPADQGPEERSDVCVHFLLFVFSTFNQMVTTKIKQSSHERFVQSLKNFMSAEEVT